MAYPEAAVHISVAVAPGRVPVPAAVAYELQPLTPALQPFLPGVGGSVAGFLTYDPARDSSGSVSLPVPILWQQVGLAQHSSFPALKPPDLSALCWQSCELWGFKHELVLLYSVF